MDSKSWTIRKTNSPIIITAIHNGHEIRSDLGDYIGLSSDQRFKEEDAFTGEWVSERATGIILNRSRFEVDLNRIRAKAVYIKPEDAWGLTVWKKKLPQTLLDKSLELYDSYYIELEKILLETIKVFGKFILLDMHSYCHRRRGENADFDTIEKNPEVIVGTSNMDLDRWRPLVNRFKDDLGKYNFMGRYLDIRENVKFPGGNQVRWVNQHFPEKGCALAIEFKKFFMNEWTGVRYPDQVEEIGKAVESTLAGLEGELRGIN